MSKSFKNISVVASATMVSRVLGLGRDILITNAFGVGALASTFVAAFTLPNLFRRLLGEGALIAAFVPTFNEELKRRDRHGAFQLVNQVGSWLLVVSGGVVVVAMISMAWVAGGGVDNLGASSGRWVEAADLAVILFPYLIFVCLAAVLSAALQTIQRFLEPALSPIWLNLTMIAAVAGAHYGGWAATPEEGIRWLCAGVLLGGLVQLLVPVGTLMREGWRPRFELSVSDPLRQIVRLMVPTLFGSAIYLINMAVSRVIGLSLNESAVALLNLATRLMELPIGVFTIAISTVVFPLIAKHAAAGDHRSLAMSYRKGMRLILVINIPAGVGLAVLATPIIRLLFERSAFTAADTQMLHPVVLVCALGLPFLSFVSIVLRAFYAHKDTTTPVRAAVISFAVNFVSSLVMMQFWGTVGLAVAGNLATVAQAFYLQWHLARRDPALGFHHLWADLAKVLVASALMGGVVAAAWWAGQKFLPSTKIGDALAVFGLIGLAIPCYGATLWVLRIEGRDDLAAVLHKLRAKFA